MDAPLLRFIGTLVLTAGAAVCFTGFMITGKRHIERMESLYLAGKVEHSTYHRFTRGMTQSMLIIAVILLLLIMGSVAQILSQLGIL